MCLCVCDINIRGLWLNVYTPIRIELAFGINVHIFIFIEDSYFVLDVIWIRLQKGNPRKQDFVPEKFRLACSCHLITVFNVGLLFVTVRHLVVDERMFYLFNP